MKKYSFLALFFIGILLVSAAYLRLQRKISQEDISVVTVTPLPVLHESSVVEATRGVAISNKQLGRLENLNIQKDNMTPSPKKKVVDSISPPKITFMGYTVSGAVKDSKILPGGKIFLTIKVRNTGGVGKVLIMHIDTGGALIGPLEDLSLWPIEQGADKDVPVPFFVPDTGVASVLLKVSFSEGTTALVELPVYLKSKTDAEYRVDKEKERIKQKVRAASDSLNP